MIFALRAESEKSSVFGLKNPAYGLKKLFWRIRNFRAKENQNWISIIILKYYIKIRIFLT